MCHTCDCLLGAVSVAGGISQDVAGLVSNMGPIRAKLEVPTFTGGSIHLLPM